MALKLTAVPPALPALLPLTTAIITAWTS